MENSQIKDLAKSALDPDTLEILRLSLNEDLYPSQIAKRLNRTTSYVVKKLKKLENQDLVKSSYVTRDGKATKKYSLVTDELVLRIDFQKGSVSLKEKNSSYLDKFVQIHPELFQSYEDYIIWATGKIHPKTVANYFDVEPDEAEKILVDIQGNIERVFMKAYETRFKNWKYGMDSGYIDFEEDWLIIPAQKLSLERGGKGNPLINRILQGETYLSVLEKEFQKEGLLDEIKKLERERLLFLENEYRPKLVNYKINLRTKEMMEEGSHEVLFSMGKHAGTAITKFINLPLETTLSSLFGSVKVKRLKGSIEISLQECQACKDMKGKKACQFTSGVLSSVLEANDINATVRETSCKAEGADACVFHGEIKHEEPVQDGAENVKQLLGG
ncbi:MAG: V4R domain-containing protein [Candidatus Hydrothermarchaeales archaeon]